MRRDDPVFVLVHGAHHGGWCWAPVARLLRGRGFDVFTPTLTGLGERKHLMSAEISMDTFVFDIMNVLLFEDLHDVVLVGHSYGARTVCGVVDRMPERIRRSIFLDGGLPLDGQSKLAALTATARTQRLAQAAAFDGGVSLPSPPAAYFGVHDPSLAAWVDRHLTPQPMGAENTAVKLDNPIGNGRPATYIRCIGPALTSTENSAAFSQQQRGWRYREIDACHNMMVTQPEDAAAIFMEEAFAS